MFKGDWLDRIRTIYRRDSRPDHYRTVFDSESGRIVLNDLVRESELMDAQDYVEPDRIQFLAGKQYMARYTLGMLRILPRAPEVVQGLVERDVLD